MEFNVRDIFCTFLPHLAFYSCSILVRLSIFLILAWHMVRICASLWWFVMFYIPRRKSSRASYDTNRNQCTVAFSISHVSKLA